MQPMLTTSPLLPYLKSRESGFYLQLAVPQANRNNAPSSGDTPFKIVHDTDPLTRLLSGKIVSDYGSGLRDVVLLTQRDIYQGGQNLLWPLTNADIDRFWQHTFKLYTSDIEKSAVILLGRQVREGALLPWGALFYCRQRNRFFHPPCPQCGSPLHQCTDDDQLTQQGLEPYTTTCMRYLACPSCLQSDSAGVFYVPSHGTNDGLPVKDQRQLIMAWGELEVEAAEDAQFPCAGCPQFENCYQTGQQALEAIIPFSFYPFHMLIFEAPAARLTEFLPLVSGAGAKDIDAHEPQRQRITGADAFSVLDGETGFVFSQTEKFFLEVLYLKLSLLSDLTRIIWPRRMDLRYPEATLDINNIWVDMPTPHHRLPVFWSYACRVIGLATTSDPGSALGRPPTAYGPYLLGTLWLYILLTNKHQQMRDVQKAVAPLLKDEGRFKALLSATDWDLATHPFLAPENLFWRPENQTVPPQWHVYWREAVQLGLQLLYAGFQGANASPPLDPQNALDDLREEIRISLFAGGAVSMPLQQESHDDAIREILSNIAGKWQRERQMAVAPPEVQAHPDPSPPEVTEAAPLEVADDVVKETVILHAKDFIAAAATEKKMPADAAEVSEMPETLTPVQNANLDNAAEEDLPETVIFKAPESSVTPAAQAGQEDDLPETVIFSTPETPEETPADHPDQEEDLPETVIFKAPTTSQPEPEAPSNGEEELPETVIISAETAAQAKAQAKAKSDAENQHQAQRAKKQQPSEEPSDDELMETVIIKPKKPKT